MKEVEDEGKSESAASLYATPTSWRLEHRHWRLVLEVVTAVRRTIECT